MGLEVFLEDMKETRDNLSEQLGFFLPQFLNPTLLLKAHAHITEKLNAYKHSISLISPDGNASIYKFWFLCCLHTSTSVV